MVVSACDSSGKTLCMDSGGIIGGGIVKSVISLKGGIW